jgi:hypothetical protein
VLLLRELHQALQARVSLHLLALGHDLLGLGLVLQRQRRVGESLILASLFG